MGRTVDLIMDSGAYSCWKKQESLTVDEYGEFLLANASWIDHAVNLDVIPGSWGRVPSPNEVEQSAEVGWKNFKRLRKQGINTMPVFHQGERIYWLDKMLDAGCDYIGISPANDRTTDQKIEWLDEIYGYLCGQEGYPKVKTHGFGVTALPLIYRYPWYSLDSVTWLLVGGYGGGFIPICDSEGNPDFTQAPRVIHFAASRPDKPPPAATLEPGGAYVTLQGATKAYVDKYLADQEFDPERLRDEYLERQRLCARFFKLCSASYMPPPFSAPKKGFFSARLSPREGQTSYPWKHIRMVFTITTSPEHSQVLNVEECRDRLVTYYYFKHNQGFPLKQYSETGTIPVPAGRARRKKRSVKAKQ